MNLREGRMLKVVVAWMIGFAICHMAMAASPGQRPTSLPRRPRQAIRNSREISTFDRTRVDVAPDVTNAHAEECFCTYENYNDQLTAYSGGVNIRNLDRVKKGDTVTLKCSPQMALFWRNGLRLSESANLTCDVCGSTLPEVNHLTCQKIYDDYAFLVLDNTMRLLPNGKIEVRENDKVNLKCETFTGYANWNISSSRTTQNKYSQSIADGVTKYVTSAELSKVRTSDAGRYGCYKENSVWGPGWSTSNLDLEVAETVMRCPAINTKLLFAVYTNDRKVGSLARLHCKDSMKNPAGNDVVICSENRQWSGAVDQACVDATCPNFDLGDNPEVSYTDGNKLGSIATFRCKAGRKVIETSRALCLGNGKWNNSSPICKKPDIRCPAIDDGGEFIILYSNERKMNSTAYYFCRDAAKVFVGNDSRKCLDSGEWSGPGDQTCKVSEALCPPIDEKGEFKIIYSDGRKVNSIARYFCKDITKRVTGAQIRICLGNGEWSCSDGQTCREPDP